MGREGLGRLAPITFNINRVVCAGMRTRRISEKRPTASSLWPWLTVIMHQGRLKLNLSQNFLSWPLLPLAPPTARSLSFCWYCVNMHLSGKVFIMWSLGDLPWVVWLIDTPSTFISKGSMLKDYNFFRDVMIRSAVFAALSQKLMCFDSLLVWVSVLISIERKQTQIMICNSRPRLFHMIAAIAEHVFRRSQRFPPYTLPNFRGNFPKPNPPRTYCWKIVTPLKIIKVPLSRSYEPFLILTIRGDSEHSQTHRDKGA